MKKIYLLLSLLSVSATFAQLSENFDSASTLPSTWTVFQGENGLGTSYDWTIRTDRFHSGTNSAFIHDEHNYFPSLGLIEDWLVTPPVDLTNHTTSSLTFYGGQFYTANLGTIYTVRVSTTSQTDRESFTTVATYAESDFTDITIPALTSFKKVNLSAYDGQTIYIAFVMTQDDLVNLEDSWYIDDVNVTGTLLSTKAFDKKSMVAVYPNPSNGLVNLSTDMKIESVEVYNLLGSLLKTVRYSDKLDISDMAKGNYLLKIRTVEGSIFNEKIIKN